MQIYSLPPGIWVTFAFFQDARDAQAVSAMHSQKHTFTNKYRNSKITRSTISINTMATAGPACGSHRPPMCPSSASATLSL